MHLVLTSNRRKAAEYLAASAHDSNFPAEIDESRDLEQILDEFPIQRKEDLIDYTESNSNSILENAILFSETSGSTGRPLQTPRGPIELEWNTQNQMLAYRRLLSRGKDRIAIIHPGMLSPFIEATTFALRQLEIGYVKVFPIEGICDYKRIAEVLARYEITAIMTTPSLALKILYEASQLNALESLKINKVLLTGELISSGCIANFKKILGSQCEVHAFVYGGSETASLMYGVGEGRYQAFLDDFIFEIIDGETKHVADDEYQVTGPLCVTWLRGGLLPIRRYNTGDVFEVSVKQHHPYIFKPLGRALNSDDSLRVAERLEHLIYSSPEPIFNYRVSLMGADRRCLIDIVTSSSVERLDNLHICIADELPDYEISLNINNANDPFLAFSAKPKLTRFTKYN